MTSKERAAEVLDLKAAKEMGDMFARIIEEGFLKGYQTGQEDMRTRAVEEAEKKDIRIEYGRRVEYVTLALDAAKRIRALPIE
jgi:hypothetical protein